MPLQKNAIPKEQGIAFYKYPTMSLILNLNLTGASNNYQSVSPAQAGVQ